MDYGWENLAKKIRIESNNFVKVMLKIVSFSPKFYSVWRLVLQNKCKNTTSDYLILINH